MGHSLNSLKGGIYRGLYRGLLLGLLRGILGVQTMVHMVVSKMGVLNISPNRLWSHKP